MGSTAYDLQSRGRGSSSGSNSISFSFDAAQFNDLIKTLNSAGPELGQKAFRKAMLSGAKKIHASVISFVNTAPTYWETPDGRMIRKERTGKLIRHIKIRNTTKYNPYFWKASVYVKRGSSREDSAYYAHMVEFGHRLFVNGKDTGRMVAPRSFMKAGIDAVEGSVRAEFVAEAKAFIAKLNRRKK